MKNVSVTEQIKVPGTVKSYCPINLKLKKVHTLDPFVCSNHGSLNDRLIKVNSDGDIV